MEATVHRLWIWLVVVLTGSAIGVFLGNLVVESMTK